MRLEEGGNDAVLLSAGEQAGNDIATCLGALCCEAQRERHGCARKGTVGGATESGGQGLAQPVRRQSLARENDDVVGGNLSFVNTVGHEFNESGGLARTRSPHDDEGFSGRTLDDGELSVIQFMAQVCLAWRNKPSACGHGVNAIGTVRQCLDGWVSVAVFPLSRKGVSTVEIRIGIVNTARELNFESDASLGDIEAAVSAALTGKDAFLKLSDNKGKIYLVPTATIGFVEVGSDEGRRVGFVA